MPKKTMFIVLSMYQYDKDNMDNMTELELIEGVVLLDKHI